MSGLFVTATGTEVGKTFVAAGVLRAACRAGVPMTALKPVMSGYDPAKPATSDAAILLEAMGRPVTAATVDAISRFRFAAPLSPDMAAALEGRSLNHDAVVASCREALTGAAPVLIEGVGGVMVPLGGTATVLDVIAALQLPVVLVVGSALGTLSHCLTAHAALAGRGLHAAATILNETDGATVPLADTAATLARFGIDVVVIPRDPTDAVFDDLLARLLPLCGTASMRHKEGARV